MSGIGRTAAGVIAGAVIGAAVLYGVIEQNPAGTGGTIAPEDHEELSAELKVGDVATHWIAEQPADNGAGPVTGDMLADAASTRNQWLHYGGDYRGLRHSPLETLNPDSVKKLQVAWAFPTGTTGQFEVSPVIHDGVMFVTTSYNRLFALDAKDGTLLWRYDHEQPKNLRLCCGPVNRGVAIAGDKVLMGTLDARLIAFDRKTGNILWNTEVAPYTDGFSLTSAPLIVGDLAITGIAGGEYGTRGFFDAYNVNTGARVWRHYTVPADGEAGVETWAGDSYKRGGAPAWTTGVYDAETDTLFWTTGNPAPDWDGTVREGDNLYSDSLLAIDPKTGALKWHFQFTPHDVWDYDGNTHIFLVDVEIDVELPVKTDMYATLESQGLTGVGFIQIQGGSRDAPLLPQSTDRRPVVIPSRASRLEKVFQSAPEIADQLVTLIARLQDFLSDENRDAVRDILGNLAVVSATLERRVDTIEAAVTDGAAAASAGRVVMSELMPLIKEMRTSFAVITDEIAVTLSAARGTVTGVDLEIGR